MFGYNNCHSTSQWMINLHNAFTAVIPVILPHNDISIALDLHVHHCAAVWVRGEIQVWELCLQGAIRCKRVTDITTSTIQTRTSVSTTEYLAITVCNYFFKHTFNFASSGVTVTFKNPLPEKRCRVFGAFFGDTLTPERRGVHMYRGGAKGLFTANRISF